jgi:hypothetical protein
MPVVIAGAKSLSAMTAKGRIIARMCRRSSPVARVETATATPPAAMTARYIDTKSA